MTVHGTKGMALVFGNSLGTDSTIWAHQVACFSKQFRVVQFEYPGHGCTAVWPPYELGQLAEALGSSLLSIGIQRFAYCGISMGGALGMELALTYPDRVAGLVLCNTAAQFGSPDFWKARMATAEQHGLNAISEATVSRWLTDEDALGNPHKVEALRRIFESTDLAGYLAACQAVMKVDLLHRLKNINVPSLIIAGALDRATPPALAKELHTALRGSEYVELPAAHLGHLGAPTEFNECVMAFIEKLS